jgi:osmotically-inducible protein OsmY
VDVAYDRRTVGSYIDDGAIEIKIREFVVRDSELRRNAHISVTSLNGIVLLTGEAPTIELRNKVETAAKNVDGVRQIVNEIRVAGKTALFSRANDTWLTSKVKTRLIKDTGLDANRVKVVSEYGNVYLLGVVTRAEGAAATDVVRKVGGVVRVVKVFEYTD